MKYDVLSLGPARMDVFVNLPDDEVSEVCSIDKKKCMIQLGFGDKIAVRGVDFAVGGNTANNAVGLTRLGLKVAMIGTVGGEWTDRRALEMLKAEGINTDHVQIDPGKYGFGVVINYQGERTILSYYPDSVSKFPLGADIDAEWVYLTTAGENYLDFYKEAVSWAGEHQAKIGFNPGTRQLKAGKDGINFVLEKTEVLFLNREESGRLVGMETTDIKALLIKLRELGPKTVVITDGPQGTYCFDGTEYLYMPIVDAPVVERTGAGDAFGSGFLAGFIKRKTLEECLIWGTVNSASVLGFIGPQKGLLKESDLYAWLEKAKTSNARVSRI